MNMQLHSSPFVVNPISTFDFEQHIIKSGSQAIQSGLTLMTDLQDEIIDSFQNFKHAYGSPNARQEIRHHIYDSLTAYAKIEDEIFYPAIRQALIDKQLLPELQLTFDPLIELVKQLDLEHPNAELHEKNILDLEKYFLHYVKTQRVEMFVKAEKLGLDTLAMGELIQKRKTELLQERQYDPV
jgi:hypothetical protein